MSLDKKTQFLIYNIKKVDFIFINNIKTKLDNKIFIFKIYNRYNKL